MNAILQMAAGGCDGARRPTTTHLVGARLIFKMKRFNQRKAEILGLLNVMGEMTALEVAGELGINQINSSRLLGLYFREGLTRRHTIDRFGTKSYQITERGRRRLGWIIRRS